MANSGQIIIPYGDAPSTPGTGKVTLYAKDDKQFYYKTEDGNEYPIASGTGGGTSDHGALTGLSDDDHTQYHTDARGDIRYYTQTQVDTISGSLHQEIQNITVSGSVTDHGELNGLLDDDHTQYHTDARGDARYYTETELDSGQLDNRYYTESEVNTISGAIVDQIVTDHGTLSGLADDDHTQYLLADGSRELTGNLTVASGVTIDGVDLSVAENQILQLLRTGVVSGGILTISEAEVTTFDISAGTGYIIDNYTTPESPEITYVTWPVISGVSPEYLASNNVTYVMLDESADVVMSATEPDFNDRRDYIILGKVIHANRTFITYTSAITETVGGTLSQIFDFINIVGPLNISGNIYSASSNNLQMVKSDGESFRVGASYNTSTKVPSVVINTEEDPVSINYVYRDGASGWTSVPNQTDMQIGYYDDGTGTLAAVSGTKWTIQPLFLMGGSNKSATQYGQETYDSMDAAYSARHDEIELFTDYLAAILRGWLIARGDCTDLSDTTKARFVNINKFGSASDSGSGTVVNTTASNVGDGLGVFKEKVVSDLRFKSLVAGSSKVDLTSLSEDISIDVVSSGISHSDLSDLSEDSHTQYLNVDGSKTLTGDWDAGDYRITASGFTVDNMQVELGVNGAFTGVLSGGTLSINSTYPNLLDITSGKAAYVDMSDPAVPIIEELSWPDTTFDPTLSGAMVKWIGIQRTSPGVGVPFTQLDITQEEKRTIPIVGRAWTTSGINVTAAPNFTDIGYDIGNAFRDLIYTVGSINKTGNKFTPSTVSMKLQRSAGEALRYGAGYGSNNQDPNIISSTAENPIELYRYTGHDWTSQELSATINPDYYDLNGVKTAVPAGKWTTQRLFWYPYSNTVVIQYGPAYYDTKSLTIDAIANEDVKHPSSLAGSVLRAYIIIKQGTTDLADTNQAEIKEAYSDEGILAGITNHGNLGGLGDDDHPQYLFTDGSRELSSDWGYGSSSISGTGNFYGISTAVDYIDLNSNLVSNPAAVTGRIFWDSTNHCASVYDELYGTTLQVGQEHYVRVRNNSGVTISNGDVVHIDGAELGVPTVCKSIASGAYQDLGVATNDIPSGSTGLVTNFGIVHDLDTTSFLPGDILYTSATVSGGFTKTQPAAPNRKTIIGWCTKTSPTDGEILIAITKNVSMGRLSDVDNAATNGDVLVYNSSTSIWEPEANNNHEHDADQIAYTNTSWYDENSATVIDTEDALNRYSQHLMSLGGSGKFYSSSSSLVAKTSPYELTVSSGTGHVIKENIHYMVTWPETQIDTTGYTQGMYYVYVDHQGAVTVSGVKSDPLSSVPLGSVYCVDFREDSGIIATYYPEGFTMSNSVSRIANALYNLGPFVITGGIVNIMPAEPMKVVSSACTVQNVLDELSLEEVDCDDGLVSLFRYAKYNNTQWRSYALFDMYMDGVIESDRYNNVTLSGATTLPYDCVFTNGSNVVTSSWDLTSYLTVGDLINATAPAAHYECPIASGIEWTGSQTNIPLEYNYAGPTVTGTAYTDRFWDILPDGKWVKHLLLRTLDSNMYFIPAQTYFDSESDALSGALPSIPESIAGRSIKVAAIVIEKGETDLTGHIVDLRPMPINISSASAGGGGGGTAVTSHSDLTGLSADDHTQYLNNARGDARYYSKTQLNAGQLDSIYYTETELNAGQLDSRYYTETELNAGQLDNRYYTETEVDALVTSVTSQIITDHGNLDGLSDDDHPQYLNTTRGDARYYTETELNAGQLDNRYYTETELNAGQLNTLYYTKTQMDSGQMDTRYYTEAEEDILHAAIVSQIVTDHGGLSGLTDDDHTQYLRVDGNRTATGILSYNSDNTFTSDREIPDKAYVDSQVVSAVFGTWYAWGGDESTTSTTSTSPVNKATLNVTGIPEGYYRLGWYYEWRRTTASSDFRARVQIDNITTVMEQSQESKDVNSWHTEAGFVISQLASGNHYFDFDFYSEISSYTSYVRKLRLEIWRVA